MLEQPNAEPGRPVRITQNKSASGWIVEMARTGNGALAARRHT
jgi:hypothetical protein